MKKRDLEIDAARGLMLVWMTLTHLPTAITPVVSQPFGYVSASEGFIFLSALFTGRIYTRLLEQKGSLAMNKKLFQRVARLYAYHLLLLFFAFTIAAWFAVSGQHPALHNLLNFYFAAGPNRAVLDSILLVYRPPLLDIIPLYIIFLIISPLVISLARSSGWKPILATSAALWLGAQLGLRAAAYHFLARHAGLQIPINEMGAFNLWGWQFLWVVGIWLGFRWANDNLRTEGWAKRAWIWAAGVAGALFVLRWMQQATGFDYGNWQFLFDKWRLSPVRVLDFAAIATLLLRFREELKPAAIRPLVMLGQASLQVFCTHFLFCFWAIGLMGNADRIYGWKQFLVIAVSLIGLLVVARIFAKTDQDASHKASYAKIPLPADGLRSYDAAR